MTEKCLFSIFVPCYNEEKILEKNISQLYDFLCKSFEFEIIIVDDGSLDRTSNIGKKLQKEMPCLRYIRYDNGPSRRENLAQSFKLAKGEIVIMNDADLAADLTNIPILISSIRDKGFDIAIGSRHVPGAKISRTVSRRLISYLFKILVRTYLGSRLYDHECGFKAFKKDVIVDLVKILGYDKKLQRKMAWDSEMLILAQIKNLKIKEIPIKWKEGKKSALRFRTELSLIPYLIKLPLKLRKYREKYAA